MSTTLLRRFYGSLLLLVLLALGARPAYATHALGGEMSYRYLDANGGAGNPFRYEITVTLYSNGLYTPANPNGIAPPPPSVSLEIYNRTNGARILGNFTATRQGPLGSPIYPNTQAGCAVNGPSQPFYLCKYVQTVSLPVSFDGFYAIYTLAARNGGIANINNSGNQNLTLYVSMAPPIIFNRSPVFSDTAVAVICQNDTTVTLNNAFDADGDRLVYTFGTPYNNFQSAAPPTPTFSLVPYNPTFSAAAPFGPGPGNFAILNASTGIAKYGATTLGLYVVAVDVAEYRNINGVEVLLGTTRRDLQLVVKTCPTTPPPVLPPTTNTPRNYTIEEGQALSIPITATQSSGNHPLVLTVNSALLDGSGPFNTTFNGSTGTVQSGNLTGTATASGTGSVSGTFVYNSSCGNARATPYDLAVTVKDNGCGGKISSDIFRITVTRAAGPNAINGPATVCDPATVRTYSAAGPVPASYNWRVVGGTISNGQGTNTVQVTWGSANATGVVVLKGISTYGCPTDSVVKTVDIRPLPALTVTAASPTVCLGASTTLTVTGQAGLTYTFTGGGQTLTGATVTVTPTATTTYTVVGTDGTCTTSATTTVTVTPPPVANAGADRTICPGVASTPLGAAALPGATYSWSPAVGLSSATAAQPTVTLPNTTGVAYVQVYTLTVTVAGGCTSTGTVRVTVSPEAIANAGPARATCAGVASAQIGTAALPGYTYSWSPATGLSSPTAAQPTVTLPNVLTVPVTTTYTVTATNAAGCTATSSVAVTVYPAAVATPGPAISFCSGTTSAPLGAGTVPVAGTTYSYSPATGLSNPTILNPTVTGTNTTGAPITTTYTLTVTTANGCVATSTVVVTINPAAVADAGPARTTCSGVPVTLGSGTAVAGTTYSYSPVTGLSNPNIFNPTVTGTNTTGAPISTTYTLTATTANGCTATATTTVTVNPAAVATPGPAVAFCSGETRALGTGAAVAGTTYAWTPTAGLSNPTSPTTSVTGTNTTGTPISTTYTLTVTTSNGCVATATVVVTVNPAAIVNPGPNRSTCSNVPVTLGSSAAVAGTTYAWTPTTGLSSATSPNPTLTLPNTGSTSITQVYTLTATTANGCTATGTTTVTVYPAAVATPGPAISFCSGTTSAPLGGGAAPMAGTTYSYSPATGLSNPNILNPTVTGTNTTGAPISTTYTLTATTANGCTATSTVVVTINPAAVATPGANQAVCSGGTITLGAAPVAGTTYSWTPGTGLSSTTVANPTFTLANTTSTPNVILFTLTATTANGCTATGTVTVTVNPAPVANAGPDAPVCDGKRLTLGTAALPGYTYSWSPATNLSSATAAQPVLTGVNTTTAPLTFTYTLTATSPQGCVGTDAVVVTVNPRPAAEAIVGPVSVCPTATGLAYSVPTPAATAYTWLIRGGTIASGQGTPAITVNWGAAATNAYVKVFRLNAQGCSSDTTTLSVIVNQVLQTVRPTGPGDVLAVAPLPTSVCQADGPYTYISGVFSNGSSYSWVITGGTQVSTFQNTVTVNWAPVTVPTIRTIVVTETSNPAGGICRGTSTPLQVLVNPSPLATLAISGPARVCQTNGPVTFALPGGFAGSTYVFQLNGATLAGTGSTRVLATLPAPGTYSLTVRETTSAGCTGPVYTTPFTVSPTPAVPTISGSGFVCDVNTPQAYAVTNANPNSTYQWTVTGGAVVTGGTGSQVTVRFSPNSAPYSVSVVEISASPALCAGPAATRIVTFDNPSLTLTNTSVDLASNNRIILTLAAPNSGNTPGQVRIMRRVAGAGAYTSVGTVATTATSFTDNSAVDAAANSYEYQLELTNGCGSLVASPAQQTIRLVATATGGQGGFDQGKTTLTWNAFVGYPVKEYQVFRRSDAGAPVLVTTVVAGSPLQATVNNADASSASGAGFKQTFRVVAVSTGATALQSNSNEAAVDFANETVVYNIITPNRDGKNDVLVIDNIGLYPGSTFAIYNRWGREVYRTTNYQNNWGSDDNVAAGTYFYLLTLPNGTTRKSWFEVVK